MDHYDDLDPEGSCMAQIQALVQSEFSGLNQPTKNEKEIRKQGRTVNHDICDSCGEGGDLLCCDRCPCAFHFTCCDPPLDEDDIPSGEWLCNECRSSPLEDDDKGKTEETPTAVVESEHVGNPNDKISPFTTLVKMSSGKNPSTFSLPPELTCHTYFPGDRKHKALNEEKMTSLKADKKESEFDEGSHLDKLCFACSRSALSGEMVECDFCPLSFHTNCLTPPLTNKPTGMWMCPNHAEHAEPGLRDPRFSRRLKAYNELRNNVSQHTIKLDFLNRVHRLRNHPDFQRKQSSWKRKRLTLVPEAIRNHYKNPPIQQLPQHIRDSLESLPQYRLPVTPPTSQEQEEWLKSVVSLQCNIAKHFASLSASKHQDGVKKNVKTVLSGALNHVISTTKTTTTCTSSSSGNVESKSFKPTSNSVPNVSSPLTQHVAVRTLSVAKPSNTLSVTTRTVPSVTSHSSLSSNVPAFNRLVTTHTITSGGKTLTKPITILYASPSKNLNQQNGVGSNITKHLTLNNCVKVSTTDNKSTLKLDSNSKNITSHSSLANSAKGNSLNDLKTLTNGPLQGVKTRTIGEVTKAVTVSSPGINFPRTLNVVSTVSSNLCSASGPTKVIVLTNSANSNIIKSIANTTLSTSIQRPLVNPVTQGNTGTNATISTSATSPTVQRIVVSGSPQKGLINSSGSSGTTTTQASSPNAVSAICAVSGLDTLQESELGKLDPRLVHVLAYQRLQQLVAQTTNKVNSTNSSVPRKISFNGTKETVVLPHNVPRGKARAVLCPINGEGSTCPMIYKTLNIGQAPDMDLCLRNYGYCNYLSDKHCCVFYDEATKQYELLNYSEHGTYVDNVLYSCDFSDKPHRTTITSSRKLDPTRLSKDKHPGDKKRTETDSASRRTSGLGIQLVSRPCNCSASSSTLIGGSGAGWEGTATLHHGSYIKVGCLQFIFSIVSHATKLETSRKKGTEKHESSASEL